MPAENICSASISVYPNPVTTDYLYFRSHAPLQEEVVIIDVSGKTIKREVLSNQLQYIDVSGLKSGVYTLSIPSKNFNQLIIID